GFAGSLDLPEVEHVAEQNECRHQPRADGVGHLCDEELDEQFVQPESGADAQMRARTVQVVAPEQKVFEFVTAAKMQIAEKYQHGKSAPVEWRGLEPRGLIVADGGVRVA